jgi:hypothetical protein
LRLGEVSAAKLETSMEDEQIQPIDNSREAQALRAFEKLRGLLKDEISALGGTEAYMRWVRSDHPGDSEEMPS